METRVVSCPLQQVLGDRRAVERKPEAENFHPDAQAHFPFILAVARLAARANSGRAGMVDCPISLSTADLPPPGSAVAIYARSACAPQGAEHSETASQIDQLSEVARRHKWHVALVAADAGQSGASLEREGLQALIKAASSGQFDHVLVMETTRLSRLIADLHVLQKAVFEPRGIRVITIEAGGAEVSKPPQLYLL